VAPGEEVGAEAAGVSGRVQAGGHARGSPLRRSCTQAGGKRWTGGACRGARTLVRLRLCVCGYNKEHKEHNNRNYNEAKAANQKMNDQQPRNHQ
jgi:hypothetical protein